MRAKHPAWDAPWLPMAPGVRLQLRYPSRAVQLSVAERTAEVMASIYDDADEIDRSLKTAHGKPMEPADRIMGEASVVSACLYARHVIEDWEGVTGADGTPLAHTDPAAIRLAIIDGAGGKDPLLVPFLAWLGTDPEALAASRPQRTLLQTLAGGGDGVLTDEVCRRCWSIIQGDPELWIDAGADHCGLDMRNALLAFDDGSEADPATLAAAYHAFAAIHHGMMERPHG